MHPVITKTFGGLSKPYYFRQFFFGLLLLAFIMFLSSRSPQGVSFGMALVVVINTVFYPYARFVFESVVDFLAGDHMFFVSLFVMMFAKLVTMALCWAGAIFIAPLGLAYLYYHHSKNGGKTGLDIR